jgi:hypothetical protein
MTENKKRWQVTSREGRSVLVEADAAFDALAQAAVLLQREPSSLKIRPNPPPESFIGLIGPPSIVLRGPAPPVELVRQMKRHQQTFDKPLKTKARVRGTKKKRPTRGRRARS